MKKELPRLRTVLARGWRRRCPQCGEGPLFRKWLTMHDHCSVCGLQYVRGQGDLWGYILLVDRAVFIFPLVVIIFLRIYNPNSVWFYIAAAAWLVGTVYTMPHRNGLGVGLNYLVRCHWGDLSESESSKSE